MTFLEQRLGEAHALIQESLTLVVGRPRTKTEQQAAADSSVPQYEFLKIRLQEGVASRFRALCSDTLNAIEQSEVNLYEADAELASGEMFLVDDDDSLRELGLFRDAAVSAATAEPIQPRHLDSRVAFYAVVVGNQERLAFVRKADPQYRHRAGAFLVTGRDSLTELEDPVFTFSPDVDFVVAPDWAAILNQHRFEMLFRETGIVARNIASWVTGITDHLPMPQESVEALQEAAVRDSRLWRKLRAIYRRGHLGDVSIDQVRAYATEMDSDVDGVIEDEQLLFDGAQRFTIMHLLNEDLFRGPMTKEIFEAQRKASTADEWGGVGT